MNGVITIREATTLLGWKDYRTAKTFFRQCGVGIFSIVGKKQKFIKKIDLYIALNRHLKNESGISLEELQSSMNVYSNHFAERENIQFAKERSLSNGYNTERQQKNEDVNYQNSESRVRLIPAMDDQKRKFIPPNKTYPGLTLFCLECNRDISGICKNNKKSINTCEFADRHRFKQYIHIAGTKNKRITRTLLADNIDDAISEAIKNKQELLGKSIEQPQTPVPQIEIKEKEVKEIDIKKESLNLTDAIDLYRRYLEGDKEVVPSFMARPRSKEHIRDCILSLKYLQDSLKENEYSVEKLRVDEIDRKAIGFFYDYLTKRFESRTLNKHLGSCTSMYKWLVGEGYQTTNPFTNITRKKLGRKEIRTITKEQFESIVNAMDDKELGKQTLRTKEEKFLWKPWLKDVSKYLLYSGRRVAEAFYIKNSDIKYNLFGEIDYVSSFDLKVNKIKNLQGDERKVSYIPATPELKALLGKITDQNRPDDFVFAPNERMQRDTMVRLFWRAFSHYGNCVYPNEKITAKLLRKTYISKLSAHIGVDNARAITKHSSMQVFENYLDVKILGEAGRDFSVFGDKEKGRSDDRQIERKKVNKNKSKER